MKNITRLVNILFWLTISLWANAAAFTATIEAWNKASLSGDVTDSMALSFLSTSKSGGKVLADNTAKLTISGLPKSTIHSITLYVRSNQKSGAGTVILSLENNMWLVASGEFTSWPSISGYSSTQQTMTCLSKEQDIQKGAQLMIYIEGSVNSVYIDQVQVDYTLAPPEKHTLTLQWKKQDGTIASQQIQEDSIGQGVILPNIDQQDSILYYQDDTWHWIGWCRTPLDQSAVSPNHWQQDDWFMMQDDCTLYALYTNAHDITLRPDSSFRSGEYALVYVTAIKQFILAGAWNDGTIPLVESTAITLDHTMPLWTLNHLSDQWRYQLDFSGDSVTIYHPYSKTWIGHSLSKGTNQPTRWAWCKTSNGTLCLYGELKPNNDIMEFIIYPANASSTYVATYHSGKFHPENTNWYLFPSTDIPSKNLTAYTTFLNWYASKLVQPANHHNNYRKYIDAQGRIVIHYNNIIFNLLGQPL